MQSVGACPTHNDDTGRQDTTKAEEGLNGVQARDEGVKVKL